MSAPYYETDSETDREVEDDMEPWVVYSVRQTQQERRENRLLREDFPQFQDDVCLDILEEVCDVHTKFVEGPCCREKKRRIMQDAAPLAEAWESADNLKKMFRTSAVPAHFHQVILFLNR